MDTLFSRRPMSLKALTSFSNLTPRMRDHLGKVYSSMFYCCISATLGGSLSATGRLRVLEWFGVLLSIGCLMYLFFTSNPHNPKQGAYRFEVFLVFGFFTGLGSGPILREALALNPSIIPMACFSGVVIFLCFSIAALKAERRSMLYLGGYLMTGMSLLLVMGLFNMFIHSSFLSNVEICLSLLVFIAYIPFDTQMILERFEMGDQDYIMHSLDLFVDLVKVIHMLIVLFIKKEDKKKDKKKDKEDKEEDKKE